MPNALIDQLRREFDESFSRLPSAYIGATEDMLLVRTRTSSWAVRLQDVLSLRKVGPLTHAPSDAPGFLGLMGLEGQIIPVFGLSELLHDGSITPEWLVLAKDSETPVGFAFGALDGYIRVEQQAEAAGHFQREVLGNGNRRYVVINLSALLEQVQKLKP